MDKSRLTLGNFIRGVIRQISYKAFLWSLGMTEKEFWTYYTEGKFLIQEELGVPKK